MMRARDTGAGAHAYARERDHVLRDREVDNLELAQDVVDTAAAAIHAVQGSGIPRDRIARDCWELLRYHIAYIEEPEDDQVSRFPWVTIRHGRADCKSQAIFIAALCAASGCNVSLKFVVLPNETQFGHVYAVVDGVAVDPALPLGDEVPYIRCTVVPLN